MASTKMLTVQEAAEILGVTDGRIRQIILEGRIRAERVGKRLLLIEPRELDKLKKNRRIA